MGWLLKGAGTRYITVANWTATAREEETLAKEQARAKGKIGVFMS